MNSNLLIYLFLCFSSTALTENSWQYVQKSHPRFFSAVTSQTTSEQMKEFFNGWSSAETKLLEDSKQKLTASLNRANNNISIHSFKKYSSPIYGMLGEIYLSNYMRRVLRDKHETSIMTSNDWDQLSKAIFFHSHRKKFQKKNYLWNEHSSIKYNIGDGIVYKISPQEESIEILWVLESKMGHGGFNTQQAKGYFERWQKIGIYVYDNNNHIRWFAPNQIFFSTLHTIRNNGEKTYLPETPVFSEDFKEKQYIRNMNYEGFLKFTLVVTPFSKKRTVGESATMPFSKKKCAQIAHEYTRIYFGLKKTKQPKQTQKKKTPKQNKNSNEALLEFYDQINRWFLLQKENNEVFWPKTGYKFDDLVGAELRKKISHFGYTSNVFIYFTNLKTKELLLKKGALPPIHNLEMKLLEASSPSSQLQDAFQIFFKSGFKDYKNSHKLKDHYQTIFQQPYDCHDIFEQFN